MADKSVNGQEVAEGSEFRLVAEFLGTDRTVSAVGRLVNAGSPFVCPPVRRILRFASVMLAVPFVLDLPLGKCLSVLEFFQSIFHLPRHAGHAAFLLADGQFVR